MKVAIATDHNGVNEKKVLTEYMESLGYEVLDCSKENYDLDNYPEFAFKVANCVASNEADLGILMCGTGIGMSIAANKVKGIRCAKVSSLSEAELCKQHNNANIMALSYKEDINNLKEWIKAYLETPFAGEERHVKRVAMIKEYEDEHVN